MVALSLALALTAAAAPASPGAPPNPAAAPTGVDAAPPDGGVRTLQKLSDVAQLCDALAPFERRPRQPDVFAMAQAEARHSADQAAAAAGTYQIRVGADRLRFAPYDPEDATLELSDRSFLSGAADALWVWAKHDPGLPVNADPATAQRVVQALTSKKLNLLLTFTLPDGDEDEIACGHVAGATCYTLAVEPYAWAYLDGDTVLARGGAGADRPLVSAAQGARPKVTISEVTGDRGPELKSAVEARQAELQGCYEKALQRNPALDGAYVAEVDPGAASRVRLALDAVGDEGLSSCVTGVLAQVARAAGGRAEIPIHFELLPATGAHEQGTGQGG